MLPEFNQAESVKAHVAKLLDIHTVETMAECEMFEICHHKVDRVFGQDEQGEPIIAPVEWCWTLQNMLDRKSKKSRRKKGRITGIDTAIPAIQSASKPGKGRLDALHAHYANNGENSPFTITDEEIEERLILIAINGKGAFTGMLSDNAESELASENTYNGE